MFAICHLTYSGEGAAEHPCPTHKWFKLSNPVAQNAPHCTHSRGSAYANTFSRKQSIGLPLTAEPTLDAGAGNTDRSLWASESPRSPKQIKSPSAFLGDGPLVSMPSPFATAEKRPRPRRLRLRLLVCRARSVADMPYAWWADSRADLARSCVPFGVLVIGRREQKNTMFFCQGRVFWN